MNTTKFIKMTEDEFYEKFTMVKNYIEENAPFSECMYETFGPELVFIQETAQKTPNKVWTIIDVDGKMYYIAGYHFVDRLGYFITEQEFDCEIEVELEGADKFQCGRCEEFFDVPKDDCCPHCGSGNYVEGCIDE